MFSRGSKSKRNGDGKAVPPSIISYEMRLHGDIISTGDVQIDGVVDGHIRCATLTVGPTGTVSGEVDAEAARIHGNMTGQLRAKSVFLAGTARMVGDITHENLAIEPGAFLNGHCRHKEADAETAVVETPDNLLITDANRVSAAMASANVVAATG
ncbi:MAG: polymer-forming cytoskeletal protein [Alphaproteobacteria bacterium]|nr:polymer-forming cytoskeletal protein [Alphaproteobacteria bacterium]